MTDEKAHADPAPKIPHASLTARLRAYFFAGLLVTAPISITLYIAWLIVDFIDQQVAPLIPEPYNPYDYGVPGVGVILVAIALILIGALTAGFLGRAFVRLSEAVVARMPVVRGLYAAMKQIFETVLAQKSTAFREVVLIEYPRRGIWTLGFITGTTRGEVQNVTRDEVVNVFIPTTPNPTSGFLLFVPRRDVHILSMSIEDGIKMVMSGGIIAPPERVPGFDIERETGFNQTAKS